MTAGFGVGDGTRDGVGDGAIGVGDGAIDVGDGAVDPTDGAVDPADDVGDGVPGVPPLPVQLATRTTRAKAAKDRDRSCIMGVRRSCTGIGSIVRHPQAGACSSRARLVGSPRGPAEEPLDPAPRFVDPCHRQPAGVDRPDDDRDDS